MENENTGLGAFDSRHVVHRVSPVYRGIHRDAPARIIPPFGAHQSNYLGGIRVGRSLHRDMEADSERRAAAVGLVANDARSFCRYEYSGGPQSS